MIYTVKLKDGTQFMGKRGFKEWFWEASWSMREYTVIASATIPMGSRIVVPISSISYMFKEQKRKG